MGNFTGFQKSEDYYIHPRLGQIKRIQKQDGPQMIQHKVLVQSEDVVNEWSRIVQKLGSSLCQDIIFLPKSHFFQRIGYCGHNGEVYLLYDDFMFSLKDEIKNRNVIKRPFPQPSVWEILYKLAKAENYLQKANLTIGSISPQNIIVNEEGDLRIVSQYSFPGAEANSYDLDESSSKLFSPEEWSQFLKIGSSIPKSDSPTQRYINNSLDNTIDEDKFNKNEAEMFSIGVTLLQICTLEQSQQIYNKNGINQSLLASRINSLNKKYSNALINIIWEMLKVNPAERIKAQGVEDLLTPHEEAILAHKNFELNYKYDTLILNTSTNTTDSREEKNRWQRFTNFFPFLRQVSKPEKAMINNVSIHLHNVPDKPSAGLAAAH